MPRKYAEARLKELEEKLAEVQATFDQMRDEVTVSRSARADVHVHANPPSA